jgi:hypothetical protein
MREDGAELRLVRRACSRLHLDQIRPHSLRGLKDTRDRLAHHTAYYGERVSAGDPALKPAQPALTPPRFDARQKSQKYQPLDLAQTHNFIESIVDVMDDLRALLHSMTALLQNETLRQKSPEPIPHPRPD